MDSRFQIIFRGIRDWWRKRRDYGKTPLEHEFEVTVNERGLRVRHLDGHIESAIWEEISEVIAITNDSGPWGIDFWYVLTTPSGECTFPLGAIGYEPAVDWIQGRPGLSVEEMTKAIRSTSNSEFLLWRKQDSAE